MQNSPQKDTNMMKLVLKATVNPPSREIQRKFDYSNLYKFKESLLKRSNQQLKLMLEALKITSKEFKDWKERKKLYLVKEELQKRYSASIRIAENRIETLRRFFEQDTRFEIGWNPYASFTISINTHSLLIFKDGSVVYNPILPTGNLLGSQLEVLIRELCEEVSNGNLSKLPELRETLIALAQLKESTS